MPAAVIAQKSSCTPCPIVQSQNPYCHSTQGSHSHGVQKIYSTLRACLIHGEQRHSQNQLPVGALPWQFEPQSLYVEVEALHSPKWVPSSLSTLPARLKISGKHGFFPLAKSPGNRNEQEPPQPILVSKWCLLPTNCWMLLWRDGRKKHAFLSLD